LTKALLAKNRDFVFVGKQFVNERDNIIVRHIMTSIQDNENKEFARG
jgi:hypothetical protein